MNILKKYKLFLENLDCADCANKIENALKKEEGLQNVSVSFASLKLTYETDSVSLEKIKEIISALEPEVNVKDYDEKEEKHHEHHHEHKHGHIHEHDHHGCGCKSHHCEDKHGKKKNINLIRLIIGIILAVISFSGVIKIEKVNDIVLILGYAVLLFRVLKNAIKLLKNKVVNENLLVFISCIGAFVVGERFEGLMVIILYEIGKILEEKAINKSRKSIAELMDIKPEFANKKVNENIIVVKPEEVKIDDILVIKKGEKIPVDGVIVKGETKLNVAALTGESNLLDAKELDSVLSGSINEGDIIEIKVTKLYEDSTVSRILNLVETAADRKAKTENFVARISRIYTPIVIILAVLVAVILPIINLEITFNESVYRSLIFLVISCPCAIAISVPLSYFSGIGKASKEGILIKGSDYLDNLKDLNIICLDKTGTITKGKFEVSKIKSFDEKYNEEYILNLACLGEYYSNHPIAKSILEEAVKRNLEYEEKIKNVSDYEEISGKGLSFRFDNSKILIGNEDLVNLPENIEIREIGTTIFVKENENILGYINLSDTIKEDAKIAVSKFIKNNIKVKMFTGDNLEIAKYVAKETGIIEVKSEMLPENKYEELEKIILSNKNGKVAFVGDGINDAPVLARADIGISMGGIGQASAIEASDIVIMTDSLERICRAIEISKKTNKIIKQNLIFAFTIKILALLLSTLGIATMWQAIFADVGVTLLTVINTLRILK